MSGSIVVPTPDELSPPPYDRSTTQQPKIVFLQYEDICFICRNRYRCIASESKICRSFVPINDLEIKTIFLEDVESMITGNPMTIKRIALTTNNKQFEIEGWQTDTGLEILSVDYNLQYRV